ncbi:hypothetical protein D3C80_1517330 [compost metagenome]
MGFYRGQGNTQFQRYAFITGPFAHHIDDLLFLGGQQLGLTLGQQIAGRQFNQRHHRAQTTAFEFGKRRIAN